MHKKIPFWLEGISAGLLFLTMVISVLDVAMRYILLAPLHWTFDLFTIYLLSTIYFFALSGTDSKGDHITVDIVDHLLPHRIRRYTRLAVDIVVLIVLLEMTAAILDRLLDAYEFNDMFTSAIVMPVWTSMIAPPIGLAAICLVRLGHILHPPPVRNGAAADEQP